MGVATRQTAAKTSLTLEPYQVILRGKIVSIQERGVRLPRRVQQVLDRSLAIKTANRYQDADEMRRALEQAL